MPKKQTIDTKNQTIDEKKKKILNFNSVVAKNYTEEKNRVKDTIYKYHPDFLFSDYKKKAQQVSDDFYALEKFCGEVKLPRVEDAKVSFDEFVKVMDSKNMVFSNLKPENNALLSAIYNLIHYDEDDLIYKVIKNMKKPGILMDTRLVYFTCITAFEGKKDLPQEVKLSLDFIKEVDKRVEAYSKLSAYVSVENAR